MGSEPRLWECNKRNISEPELVNGKTEKSEPKCRIINGMVSEPKRETQ